jgi:hypothetical protein
MSEQSLTISKSLGNSSMIWLCKLTAYVSINTSVGGDFEFLELKKQGIPWNTEAVNATLVSGANQMLVACIAQHCYEDGHAHNPWHYHHLLSTPSSHHQKIQNLQPFGPHIRQVWCWTTIQYISVLTTPKPQHTYSSCHTHRKHAVMFHFKVSYNCHISDIHISKYLHRSNP